VALATQAQGSLSRGWSTKSQAEASVTSYSVRAPPTGEEQKSEAGWRIGARQSSSKVGCAVGATVGAAVGPPAQRPTVSSQTAPSSLHLLVMGVAVSDKSTMLTRRMVGWWALLKMPSKPPE